MRPFDFVITFLAFIYALALAHLLLAAAHMIRHRRELVFDWAHALWMAAAFALLWANWISLWDFHTLNTFTLATIAIGFLYSINQYLVCALVSPRLDGEDGFNMHVFHETQGRAYIVAFVVLIAVSIPINYLAGAGLNIQSWTREDLIVIAMLPIAIAPLLWRARWVQIGSPLALLALLAGYMVMFYSELR
ncbi:MAG: hypothetical protein WA814_02030 [Candidatus Baltobacteraceae bacterium]